MTVLGHPLWGRASDPQQDRSLTAALRLRIYAYLGFTVKSYEMSQESPIEVCIMVQQASQGLVVGWM